MNRRQEIAAWVFVLLLAGPRMLEALDGHSPLQDLFLPLLIVAPMAVYSLRTRVKPPALPEAARRGGIAAMVALLAAGTVTLAAEHEHSTDTSELDEKADASQLEELSSSVEDLKREVEELSFTVDRFRYR